MVHRSLSITHLFKKQMHPEESSTMRPNSPTRRLWSSLTLNSFQIMVNKISRFPHLLAQNLIYAESFASVLLDNIWIDSNNLNPSYSSKAAIILTDIPNRTISNLKVTGSTSGSQGIALALIDLIISTGTVIFWKFE